jgi:hypothetical protein
MTEGEEDDEAEGINEGGVAEAPNDTADPRAIIEAAIPRDILDRYEVHSYRSAAMILSRGHEAECTELMEALRGFSITTDMIRRAGGNESEVPKLLSSVLRPKGWHETAIRGDLLVTLGWREQTGTARGGRPVFEKRERELRRARFLDGHKVDYVKGKVAFDLEWNSKDQTFDRDLYAFSAFATCGVIDVAVLVTRSASLNPVFRKLGPALGKDGRPEKKRNGAPRMTAEKYGASTTWMGKLLYRLNAGRNGACPVLAFGITPRCIEDWTDDESA